MEQSVEIDTNTNKQRKSFAPVKEHKKAVEVTFAEDEVDALSQDTVEEVPTESVVTKKVEPKKTSRSEKRIRELNAQKNELAAELESERMAKAELMKQLREGNTTNKEVIKTNLVTQITLLTNQLREAMTNADADKAVDLQDQLMDAKLQLAGVSAELSLPTPKEPVYTPQSRAPEIPEKALDWIEEHPEFKTDEIFYAAAMTTNNRLLSEGFNPNDDEFYTELNLRLTKRFPEVFGIQEENDVEYALEETPSQPVKDVKQKSPVSRTTVSGASRTPSPTASTRKPSSNTVKLSPDDIAQAEKWGWSLERFARRKLHLDKNRREDGYVPIMMPTTESR